MEPNPFISVIIPNYNHARYLDQRIQSVLGQTYQNFEVIILDDCSTDNSLEVIEKYRSNPHVVDVIVNKTNSGNTFLQWDKGIKVAKGDWIWIAESDDYCEPNLLEELVKAAGHRKDTVLAYSTLRYAYEDDAPVAPYRIFRNQYFSGNAYIRRYLSLGCMILNASCAIFKKNAALNVSPIYKTMPGAGDYFFWVMIAEQGRVAIVNKQLSIFRRHNGTVTSKKDSDGTNALSERIIFDYMRSKMSFSSLRLKYVWAHHAWIFRYGDYDSEEIQEHVYDVWDVMSHTGKTDEIMLKAGNYCYKKFNYFL